MLFVLFCGIQVDHDNFITCKSDISHWQNEAKRTFTIRLMIGWWLFIKRVYMSLRRPVVATLLGWVNKNMIFHRRPVMMDIFRWIYFANLRLGKFAAFHSIFYFTTILHIGISVQRIWRAKLQFSGTHCEITSKWT